jgi:RNA polymerase sigma factor (sigma-70 family)
MSDQLDSANDALFARARTGDQDAWRILFETCYPKVLRVIRKRLNSPAMRSLYDSTDFISDVWKSLAEKKDDFDFSDIDALMAFLSRAAERKVIDEHRRLHTLKNDINRQRPIGAWLDPGQGVPDLPSHDPSPSQLAQASETQEHLLSGQTGDDRRVIELKREGFSNDEVALKTGWSLRKVQRFLKDLGDSWIARGRGEQAC